MNSIGFGAETAWFRDRGAWSRRGAAFADRRLAVWAIA